jgi:hypothetical protein
MTRVSKFLGCSRGQGLGECCVSDVLVDVPGIVDRVRSIECGNLSRR